MDRKVGQLSNEEKKYIVENCKRLSIDEIAENLGRKPDTVKAQLLSRGLWVEKSELDIEEETRLRLELYHLPYWPSIINGYMEDEVVYFEENWIALMRQLGGDVSYSEHLFIKDWLVLELQKARLLKKEKETLLSIEEQRQTIKTLEKSTDPADLQGLQMIRDLKVMLVSMEGALSQNASVLEKLNKDIKNLSQKLKADRESRRHTETDMDTYWKYAALINDEKFKNKEDYRAELGRAAQEKARENLMELTDYIDQTVDFPLLNAETLERYDAIKEKDD
jgi:hypothetical protein